MYCIPNFLSENKSCVTCILSFCSNLTSSISLSFSCYSLGKKQMTTTENWIIVSTILATILLKNLNLAILTNPDIFVSRNSQKLDENNILSV